MQCRNCGHHNSGDARFCARCGTGLTVTCGVCGTVAEAGAAFCTNCGAPVGEAATGGSELHRYLPQELLTKLEAARTGRAMTGERRTVTMLFADIRGSTAAAETLDPEDWAEIINGAFEHLIAPVYRYEGTLARLQGDAVLAFFGAPIAHEDDPVRALRAGLEIVEAIGRYRPAVEARWGIAIDARVGVHTGLVVVGEVGSDLRVEYTALGDAINVAARMEQTAEPGTVRVTGHTRSLVGATFEFEELGVVEVKGRAEPVAVNQVLRFLGHGEDTVGSVLVGRDAELSRLDSLVSQLVAGTGWIASVTAEAGVGKSRLLREFHDAVGSGTMLAYRYDQPGDVAWLTGAGRSYDTTTPFAAVRDVLSRWWALADADDAFARVKSAIAASGLGDVDAAALLSHVAGVDLEPSAAAFVGALESPVLHSRAAATFVAYLEQVAQDRPLLVVLEDVHWADDLSLALFESTMELTERLPIGLIVAMRPYREDSSWRIHQVAERDHPHRYHPLPLTPLTPDGGGELLDALLGEAEISADMRSRILERAAGNPLFLEEIVRSLGESGSEDHAVPSSLSAILTARLDRLDDSTRFVVQMASVIGSEFDRTTLAALMDRPVPDGEIVDLLRRGILVDRSRGMLAFRHVLMQEAAYETILRRTRRELHRAVADHLIREQPDAVQEIARHLTESGDVDEAFPYLVEAGVRATRAMALADAIRLLADAIDHTPIGADPEVVVRAHDTLGTAYSLVPDLSAAAAAYQSLYDYGEQSARPAARVAALNRLGFATASLGGSLEDAASYLEQARSLAEEERDDVGLAEYHMNSCFVASMSGDLRQAVGHDEVTVELGERVGADWIRLAGMLRRAVNYTALLELEQAEAAAESALSAADAAGSEETRAILESFSSAVIRYWRGDLRGALDLIDGAQPTFDRYQSFYVAMNQVAAASILFEVGEPEAALSRYVDAQRIARQSGQNFVMASSSAGMAFVYASAGIPEPLTRLREEALAALASPMGEFLASNLWGDLGWAGLASRDPEQAEADFARGLAASSIASFTERPRLLAGKTLALIALDRLAEAGEVLDEVGEYVRSKGLTAAEPMLAWVEAEYLVAMDDLDGAAERLAVAHESAMSQGRRCLLLPILAARARLAGQTDDSQGAAHHLATGLELIETIVAPIVDQELAAGLRTRWRNELERSEAGFAG
ncbi:MAG TPA: adenylate/guanylate cyclase domain-containing protein [Acidimicrobiia bacterium]|nr:adenylate/guanylate cyclase domain-containing protein [Acidimicrobiia bacterium]